MEMKTTRRSVHSSNWRRRLEVSECRGSMLRRMVAGSGFSAAEADGLSGLMLSRETESDKGDEMMRTGPARN